MVHAGDATCAAPRSNRPDMAPLLMGSPRSPLPHLNSSPSSLSPSSSGCWPSSRWLRVDRNAFAVGIEEAAVDSWTLSDFMMQPDKRIQSSFGCTESFPLLSAPACEAALREVHAEADGEGEASVLVGLGRNSIIRSLFCDSESFGNLINRVIDVPVVVHPGARVHHLRRGAAPAEMEFVRDSSSSFQCVILLTPVPDGGLVCSYLRRWDGAVETLSFPPGPAGSAFLLHGSQIDHTVLPWADHDATVLCIPIHPADGWIADEELCSTQETELADWSDEGDEESGWALDECERGRPSPLPTGGKPVTLLKDLFSKDLRIVSVRDAAVRSADDQFLMDP